MAIARLPPGFRFHPTDVELILYYLKRKVLGKPLAVQAITEIDLYKYAPSDLPDKSSLCTKDLEWYFFCARDNRSKTKRATETGYWKMTGRDKAICDKSQVVGMRKTLVFHIGRGPHGTRTNWVMHEYRLHIKDWIHTGITQDSYALCKIFEKSGMGPKNGEQHGAPFKEEEWEDELIDESAVSLLLFNHNTPSTIVNDDKVTVTEGGTHVHEKTCKSSFESPCQSSDIKRKGVSISEHLDMDSKFAILGEENDMSHSGTERNQVSKFNHVYGVDSPPPFYSDDIFGDLDDLNTRRKMDGMDLLDFSTDNRAPLLWDAASGQNLFGPDIAYVELNDLECPMKYPVEGDGPNHIQSDNFSVESFRCILPTNSNTVENNLDMVSNDHVGFGAAKNISPMDLFDPLTNNHGDVASGQNRLGDGLAYVELNDFECPMKYAMGGGVPDHIQYENSGVESFGCVLPTYSNMLLEDSLDMASNYPIGFGVNKNSPRIDDFSMPLISSKALTSTVESSGCMLPRNPSLSVDDLKVASNDQFGFGASKINSLMDIFPFVSSETVHPTCGVESSKCILPNDSDVFADNLDAISHDHNSFGITANRLLKDGSWDGSVGCKLPTNTGVLEDDLNADSNVHIGFGVTPNRVQTSSRGEQHRDNLRLQCLLGSILAHPVSAAEYPSSIIAGDGSNGTSLSVNHGGSSLDVKAEVTVCCGCTKDALSGKFGVFPNLCCGYKILEWNGCSGLFNIVVVAVCPLPVVLFIFSVVAKLCVSSNDFHDGMTSYCPDDFTVTKLIS